jgi:hypothetical protein
VTATLSHQLLDSLPSHPVRTLRNGRGSEAIVFVVASLGVAEDSSILSSRLPKQNNAFAVNAFAVKRFDLRNGASISTSVVKLIMQPNSSAFVADLGRCMDPVRTPRLQTKLFRFEVHDCDPFPP